MQTLNPEILLKKRREWVKKQCAHMLLKTVELWYAMICSAMLWYRNLCYGIILNVWCHMVFLGYAMRSHTLFVSSLFSQKVRSCPSFNFKNSHNSSSNISNYPHFFVSKLLHTVCMTDSYTFSSISLQLAPAMGVPHFWMAS